MKFRAKFEIILQKQFLSVAANHSKSDFSTVSWVADSEEIRQVHSTEIFSNAATIREVNSTEIDSNFTARETQDYAPLQRQATNNQTNSHNFKTLN